MGRHGILILSVLMAGDWIPMRCDIRDDPEVIAIAEACSLDFYAVVGRFHHLWSWSNLHLENGHADSHATSVTKSAPKVQKRTMPPPTRPPDEWREVKEDLRKLGVAKAAVAVEAARKRGLAIDDANGLIAHFRARRGAWQPGALYRMLTGEVSEWPEPAEDYSHERRREEEGNKWKQKRAANARRRAQKKAEVAVQEKREKLHGNRLDGMTDEQRQEVAVRAGIDRQMYRHNPELERIEMLEALAEWNGEDTSS